MSHHPPSLVSRLVPGRIIRSFTGKSLIIDACKFMDLAVDTFDEISGESETMAGLLLEITGEIPKAGQEIRQGDFLFKVLEVNKNRIDKLMVTIIRQS